MVEKRYKLEQWTSLSLYYSFPNGNLHHSIGKVAKRVENDLNSLAEENEQLKQRIIKLELLNNGLNYALKYIRKIDVEIDIDGDLE